jgi:hypothetical protein
MRASVLFSAVGVGAGLALLQASPDGRQRSSPAWQTTFAVDPAELSSTGSQPYFDLTPGHRLVLEHGAEQLTITVLPETKRITGIETRVVEERETRNGQLVEVSRNYFAMSTLTRSVFYFGEDVDMYEHGKVVSHEGAWLAGEKGAKFGLMMPGKIALRSRYSQELAPGIAMDRAEIVSLSATVTTPAGRFVNCLKVEETTPLEPAVKEYKYYAAGTGLVQDGDLKLTKK